MRFSSSAAARHRLRRYISSDIGIDWLRGQRAEAEDFEGAEWSISMIVGTSMA